MTEQLVEPTAPSDGMPLPESHAEDAHVHGGVHDPNLHHSPEEIKREIRVYLWVFAGLAMLTALTVYACYGLRTPVHVAIGIALAIACMKGFLVAGFFMHLLSEKRLIYSILGLTVVFFAILMWGPWNHWADMIGR
ncbi:MAG TPA: cytochrome C oxidase subunit IV family protein [Thermoanaerobaculia bacterium]|nr:cytochrome C oxidase subunit IV family protein [Thermoanaerobaculia bacterium]